MQPSAPCFVEIAALDVTPHSHVLVLAMCLQASASSKWLSKHRIDPNDPRNALLLELLRAREAAAHSGQALGAAGIFRCALSLNDAWGLLMYFLCLFCLLPFAAHSACSADHKRQAAKDVGGSVEWPCSNAHT